MEGTGGERDCGCGERDCERQVGRLIHRNFLTCVIIYLIFRLLRNSICSNGMIEVCEEFCMAQEAFVATTPVWDDLR